MAKVVIHIGTHKTATTTIQDTFSHNAKLLRQHGVIYPRLSRFTGHHGLVSDWGRLPKVYDLPGGSKAAMRQIAKDHGEGDHTVFLSSEEFSRGGDGQQVDFAELRRELAGFDQFEVICVLRPQWQFIQSVYLELAKTHTPPPPPNLVSEALTSGLVQGLWTDYNLLYDHLLQAFAPEEITLLDFETCRRHSGGVVGMMLEQLKCPLAMGQLDLVNGGVSNASPLSLPTWAASLISTPQPAPQWLIDCTTGAFQVEFGEKAKPCLFSRPEYNRLTAQFTPANARLAERRAPYQPGFAITELVPDSSYVFREAVAVSYWLRCNRWIFAHKQGRK